MNTIKAYRLHKDTMGPPEDSDHVYTDEETAKLIAEDKPRDEFTTWKVNEVSVRVITQSEGAVGKELVLIDRTTPNQIHRERGLRKLTSAEREALKLWFTNATIT